MYRLLIADDEEAIRTGIAETIPWEEWGYEICGLCENGRQVMECIGQCKPDIVLSDIRMPEVDGIELMQYLNREYPQIKIVILSGYSDFEYLNMSIRNRVTEYLLKPTDIDEFEVVFRRMKETLDEERRKSEQIDKSVHIHFQEWLCSLLEGVAAEHDTQRFLPVLEETGVSLQRLMVICYVPDDTYNEEEEKQFKQQVKELRETFGETKAGRYLFFDRKGNLTEFWAGEPDFEGIKAAVREFLSLVKRKTNRTISAGISELCEDAEMLPLAYEQAVCCAKQNLFSGQESVFCYSELLEVQTDKADYFHADVIERAILDEDFASMEKEVDRVLSSFDGPMLDYRAVDKRCISLIAHISLWGVAFGISMDDLMRRDQVNYSDIYDCPTLEKKKEFVLRLLCMAAKERERRQSQGQVVSRVIKKLQSYVDEQYCSNTISLESVAAFVQKTPAYVSRLFKKELHCNFTDYLTEKRMERAQELLRETDDKIYEIAQQCGYADTSNFIRVFRKAKGVSPAEYRAMHG